MFVANIIPWGASKDSAAPAQFPAGHYYVAPLGNDSGDGSTAHPWRTIQYASTRILPGATVHVAPGNYIGQIVTRANGRPAMRIVYLSDERWGARINSPVRGDAATWQNYGNYVDIVGFDVSGNGNVGIFNKASFTRMIGNHVHNIPASLCSHLGGAGIVDGNYSATDADIIGNMIHDIGVPGDCFRVHGIYHSVLRGRILNNISYHNSSWGIQLWHAATNVVIANNTVFANGGKSVGGGMNIGAGDAPGGVATDNCIVSNNILYRNAGAALREYGRVGDKNRYLNNLVFNNGRGLLLTRQHRAENTIEKDPQFVVYNPTGMGNYRLQPNSPAIDAGTSVGAPDSDFDGGSRPIGRGYDMGAYEFGSPPAPWPHY